MAIFNPNHGQVRFMTADGVAKTVIVGPGQGNFQVAGHEEGDVDGTTGAIVPRSTERIMNRGRFQELVYTEEKALTGSITVLHDGVHTHAVDVKAPDVVAKTGAVSASTTQDPGGQVWTTNVEWSATRAGVTVSRTYYNCRITEDFSESMPANTLAYQFTCHEGFKTA